MTATAEINRRSLFRGQFPTAASTAWQPIDGLAAGSGDVFWAGWADDEGVFVAGDEGVIFHFDGTVWDRMDVPAALPVHALWGQSRDDLWAVGWMGLILRFDGTAWVRLRGGVTTDEGRYAATDENTPLFAIDGRADGTAWAVGDSGTILRLDDGAWHSEASRTRCHLRTVRCLGDGRVLAGGADGTLRLRDANGVWGRVDSPVGTTYVAALEVEPGTLLLAGGRYFADGNSFRGDLVLLDDQGARKLFDGAQFRRFRDLARTRAGILAVGDGGQIHLLRSGDIDRIDSGTSHDLQGLISLPEGEALAVGDFGTVLMGSPAALTAFAPTVHASAEASPWEKLESGTDRQLWGLWRDEETGTLHACGEEGTVLLEDRGKWEALPPPGDLGIHAMARAPDGGLFAAGQLGEIHHFDGSVWRTAFDLMMDVTILSLWSDGAGALFAAGDEGLVLRHDTGAWTRMPSGTRSALYGLWGEDAEHVLAVGDFGLVLRWNGTRWDEFNAGTENFLFDVWGRGLDDIFIVGLSGTIGHFDGKRWRITPARARRDLLALAGTPTWVAAVGAAGAAMVHDGARWTAEETGTDAGLRALSAGVEDSFVAAGDGGVILRRRSPADR